MTASGSVLGKDRPVRWHFSRLAVILAVILTGVLMVSYGVLPVSRAIVVARPQRKALARTPYDVGLSADSVSFVDSAGETIRGWYVPGQNGAVVVVSHGFGSNKSDELDPARWLADAGYGVLLVDLAAHGESGGDRLAVDGREIIAAVTYLQDTAGVKPGRIGLRGFSLGGLASLQAAAQSPAVGAVVADGSFPVVAGEDMPVPSNLSEWLWLPFDAVQRLALRMRGVTPAMSTVSALRGTDPRPVLLVAGTQNAGERLVMRHYAAAAGDNVTLWEVPEAGHTEALSVRREEYLKRVLAWFDRALVGASGAGGTAATVGSRRSAVGH
jgi:uncharacterized protein